MFPFPYISRQRKDSQHSPRPSTSPVVYYEEKDAGRFSAQEQHDNFGLCQAKKTLQRFEWSKVSRLKKMCIILFNVLLDLMTCHLRYVTVRD